MIPGAPRASATQPPIRVHATMRGMSHGLLRLRPAGAVAGALGASLAFPIRALAHGPVPAEPPSVEGLLLGWSFEPAILLPLALVATGWVMAVRRVDAAHPASPVPRVRTIAFLAGLIAIAVALQSGIERYDTALFSVHMVQHILLTLVAAPLLALGAPVTLLLRLATPPVRGRWILPILHSRLLRVLSHPVVAGLLFAGVMWAAHFSPLFDLALENRLVHDLEHVLFLGSALLFWWPAVGLDPAPWRLSHPARLLYVFLQMPQNTFLAVVILNASAVLYPHYVTLARPWGPTALFDQQTAGGIMWLAGDMLFIVAIAAILAGWMRHEERDTARAERRADVERAAIRTRESRLAERLAEERDRR
jgi:cytochrome c oxidase assembly factor CtaG